MSEVAKGKHLWFDLMTTDPGAAKDFYTKVVGWKPEKWQSQNAPMPYDMWMTENGPIGGVMQLPEEAAKMGAPSHWIAYIGTPDVDQTVEQAKKLGATLLHGPMDIPEVGRFATLADPFGAVFAAYTPAGEMPGHDGMPRPGEMSWHELMTKDWGKAFDFYATLFGWEKGEPMDMGPMGVYQIFHQGGAPIGGMMNLPDGVPVSHWMYYVRVSDLDGALDRVKANGGQVLNGPMDVPGGDKIAQCMDPTGAAFALHMSAQA
ncbi:MAG: VOC family protein [Gemmatimonadota bacterium]